MAKKRLDDGGQPPGWNVFSEKTLLPVSLVITIIGGTTFVTKTHFDNQENSRKIDVISEQRKEDRVATDKKLEQLREDIKDLSQKLDRFDERRRHAR